MRESSLFALDRLLHRWALEATVPQLSKPIGAVPSQEYLSAVGYRRLGWRALHRKLVFLASGQASSRIASLQGVGPRGLWLYFGEGQIGDALMDLAPRSLLHKQGFKIDLLADGAMASLFADDPWLGTVTDDVSLLDRVPYDFAIVLSRKRRSIQLKRRHYRRLPWVSILESFTGPNFDRAGYATRRIADLLGLDLDPAEFSFHASQKLRPRLTGSDYDPHMAQVRNSIAIGVGGADPVRTFAAWTTVIAELVRRGRREFLLLGSDNGVAEAQRIERAAGGSAHIHNFVGRCSVAQSHDLLSAARMVACTDGGLLHLAATTGTPIVALFASTIRPEWRLSARPGAAAISSPTIDVNGISAHEVVEKMLQLGESAGAA